MVINIILMYSPQVRVLAVPSLNPNIFLTNIEMFDLHLLERGSGCETRASFFLDLLDLFKYNGLFFYSLDLWLRGVSNGL